MKVLMILLLIVPLSLSSGQKIGELAPARPQEIFPNNAWGVDVMFCEGGFGLGTFLRKSLATDLTGFIDFSISETKDEREVSYIDYFGNTFTPDKVNRSFQLPINFGVQYRMFSESLTENLRPYLTAGVGPTLIITTPYDKEFFDAFGYAQTKYALDIDKQKLEREKFDYEKSKPIEEKRSSIYQEFLDYKKEGGKLDFNSYQTMDANRKRSVSNTNVYNVNSPESRSDMEKQEALHR